jgi:hypothetical protein
VETQWFVKTEEIQPSFSWQKANGFCFLEEGQKSVLLAQLMNPEATIISEGTVKR